MDIYIKFELFQTEKANIKSQKSKLNLSFFSYLQRICQRKRESGIQSGIHATQGEGEAGKRSQWVSNHNN